MAIGVGVFGKFNVLYAIPRIAFVVSPSAFTAFPPINFFTCTTRSVFSVRVLTILIERNGLAQVRWQGTDTFIE